MMPRERLAGMAKRDGPKEELVREVLRAVAGEEDSSEAERSRMKW